MRDNERQRMFMFGTNVNEMNVQVIDLGDELRQRIELRLDVPPIVIGCPVPRQFLKHRERHALRCIGDRFAFRPSCCLNAPAQVRELRLRNVHAKRTNFSRCVQRFCGIQKTQRSHSNGGRCGTAKITSVVFDILVPRIVTYRTTALCHPEVSKGARAHSRRCYM